MKARKTGPLIDPYWVWTNGDETTDLTGRVEVDASTVPQGPRTLICPLGGQSVCLNMAGTLYDPNDSHILHVNILNGKLYKLKDPLVGIERNLGCVLGHIARGLIDAGIFDYVVWAPYGVGGTSCRDWSGLGPFSHRHMVMAKRLRALGLTPTCWLWDQGNQDNDPLNTSTAAYVDYFTNANYGVEGQIRALGYSGPIMINVETMHNGTVDSNVQAAQNALPNGTTRRAGANVDSISMGGRRDDVHLNDTGTATLKSLMVTAFDAVF